MIAHSLDNNLFFHHLVNRFHTPIHVCRLKDDQLNLIYSNIVGCKETTSNICAMINTPLEKAMPIFQQRDILTALKAISRNGGEIKRVLTEHRDDTADEWFAFHGFSIPDNCVAFSLVKITAQILSEQHLSEKQEAFRTMFRQSPVAIQIMEPSGLMIEVNKAWEELWRAKAEDAVGKYNILDDEQALALGFGEKFKLALRGLPTDVLDFPYDPKNSGYPGRKRWLTSRVYPLKNSQGKVFNIILTLEDITVQKETELNLILEKEKLEEKVMERTLEFAGANERLKQEIRERKEVQEEREQLISDLQQALNQVKVLSGLLPICSSCKKIRDEQGTWNQMEQYIKEHTDAEFSHSMCPECAKRMYPDLFDKK
ncbi:MAG: PAS domain S-box protein [Desulfobulbaceae bacterium]|nr:PAS domain S-box protein [Desulfobulbaceae bacterium]